MATTRAATLFGSGFFGLNPAAARRHRCIGRMKADSSMRWTMDGIPVNYLGNLATLARQGGVGFYADRT